MAQRTKHEHTLKEIDVELRNSVKYGVTVIQSRADDATRDSVRRILVNDWADVSQRSHVVISSANNTIDVLVEQ